LRFRMLLPFNERLPIIFKLYDRGRPSDAGKSDTGASKSFDSSLAARYPYRFGALNR
jgi:hypothetical protein